MADFAQRRITMVDTQVRPSDVTSFQVLDAMLSVPRELFVPSEQRDAAYAGTHVGLGHGRVVLAPRTMAKLLQVADVQHDELVLDVGAGLGYSSALAACMAEAVIALEEDAELAREAERALSEASADNVAVINGVLVDGASKHGPYDVVLIEGAVQDIPDALFDQLKVGGRIVAIFVEGALGTARVGYKNRQGVSWRFAFNAAAPVLPGFEKQREFAL
ncbi:MAG: protein-L-isoaspartate O-methyltransferase [Boseongicola sp. SB0662_bin_57]|nr:protein-L-isoaspartate O-methyltransferase [Boseongicola sp. SB0662_bin_57]